jgi:hypothetical protein
VRARYVAPCRFDGREGRRAVLDGLRRIEQPPADELHALRQAVVIAIPREPHDGRPSMLTGITIRRPRVAENKNPVTVKNSFHVHAKDIDPNEMKAGGDHWESIITSA